MGWRSYRPSLYPIERTPDVGGIETNLKEKALKFDTPRVSARTTTIDSFNGPRIVVLGCGGAGNNSIHRISQIGIRSAETIAINTDRQHLEAIRADKKILIGKTTTRGLGAGGMPEVAERAVEESRLVLEHELRGADLLFLLAGMGGGTGTGSAHMVAGIAKRLGAIVIALVTTPFNVERERRAKAREGLEKLRRKADAVIVLDNNRLVEIVGNLPMERAFSTMDQLIAEIVKGVTETITVPSLINLDYADIKSIMSNGGISVLMYGESTSLDPETIVRETLSQSLIDLDYRGATGCLVHITGGANLSLRTVNDVAQGITAGLRDDANVIFGARIDESLGNEVHVMAIMTGIRPKNQRRYRQAGESYALDDLTVSSATFAVGSNRWEVPWVG